MYKLHFFLSKKFIDTYLMLKMLVYTDRLRFYRYKYVKNFTFILLGWILFLSC